jgi:hypothetical protein
MNEHHEPTPQERKEATIDAFTRELMDERGCSYDEARLRVEAAYNMTPEQLAYLYGEPNEPNE